MRARPTILAPIDFSDASRSALRYARVIASHFGARLVVLAVEDPLLTEAIDIATGHHWDPEDTRRELAYFAAGALGGSPLKNVDVEYTKSRLASRPGRSSMSPSRKPAIC